MKYEQIMRAIGEADGAELLYHVQIDSRLYGVHADTASHATMEVLVGIGEPDTWPDECEVWIASTYRKQHRKPVEVILVPRHGVMTWSYEGDLRNGKPHGQGVMTRYEVKLRNGKPPHGQFGVRVHDDEAGDSFVVWPEWVDEFPRYEVKLSDTRAARLAIAKDHAPWCYEGDFRNGKPHGRGVVTFRGGHSIFRWGGGDIRLEGSFRNGKLNGQGVMTFPARIYLEGKFQFRISTEGGRYKGEFRNELPHGRGVMTFADGGCYRGEFRDGELHGWGVMTFADGKHYKGEFRDGKPHGQGTSEGRYEGEFRNELPHGQGIMTFPHGERREGEFRNGKLNGQGVMTFASGERYEGGYRYEGEFRNGKPHGRGVEEGGRENPVRGSRYEGEFRKGLRHGRGVMEWRIGGANGKRYEGEFRWQRPREGVLTYPNGKRYEVEYIEKDPSIGGYPNFISSDPVAKLFERAISKLP